MPRNEIDKITRHFRAIEHPLCHVVGDIGLETEADLL